MLRADAMMDTAQPGFEVGKYEMSDGHELFGNLWIAPFRDGYMDIAVLGKPGVAALQSSVMILAPGATTLLTKPQSESALRSGTKASLTRPA